MCQRRRHRSTNYANIQRRKPLWKLTRRFAIGVRTSLDVEIADYLFRKSDILTLSMFTYIAFYLCLLYKYNRIQRKYLSRGQKGDQSRAKKDDGSRRFLISVRGKHTFFRCFSKLSVITQGLYFSCVCLNSILTPSSPYSTSMSQVYVRYGC